MSEPQAGSGAGDDDIDAVKRPDVSVGAWQHVPGLSEAATTMLLRSRELTVVAVLLALTAALSVGLLAFGPPRPEAAVAVLVLCGLAASASCARRAATSDGQRSLAWSLLSAAAGIAVVGNALSGALGSGSLAGGLTDASIAAALVCAIVGTLLVPAHATSRSRAFTRLLDGLVSGCAALIIASAVVYSPLLAATEGGLVDRASVLIIPVLDVVLVTAVASQAVRAEASDRVPLLVLMAGFACYAVGDLYYAVVDARSFYEFGTWTDLGWAFGYLFIAAAGALRVAPSETVRARRGDVVTSTVLMFVVIAGAGVAQAASGISREVQVATAVLWLVLLLAAAVRQVALTVENVGLRRGLERTVAAQTEHLRHLLRERIVLIDSVGDGIYAVGVGGEVTLMNRSGRELLGLGSDLAPDVTAHDLFHAGEGHTRSGCYVTAAITEGVTAAVDDVYLRPDGSQFVVEVTASPIIEDDGLVTGAVVAFRDATQRRQVERMKQDFLSVVSHELRTPLTAIRGSLRMLDQGAVGTMPDPGPRLMRMASDNTDRLTRLVDDILDVERLTSGRITMKFADHPVAHLLSAALNAVRPQADLRGVEVVVDTFVDGTDSAAALVRTDTDRFGQVVTNLVGNAVKFSEPGGRVTITVRPGTATALAAAGDPTLVEPSPAEAAPMGDRPCPGDTLTMAAGVRLPDTAVDVLFGVHDTGRGIPAHRLGAIFERFHQIDSSDARREGGMGLGLTITRDIVEQMGGRIWAQSTPEAGSDFWFTLPRALGPPPIARVRATGDGDRPVVLEPGSVPGPAAPSDPGGQQ